ncbi:LysR family transcriptional regulator [Ottowia thiooxydans]|uniref:DNA-binding transcriptional LysR family regulator n=1 Tax=Ottowia thiooxydans TaxID=219182 RepID=A0ABV2Q4E3_9BURK
MAQRVTIRQMECFIAVAEAGHFTVAASRLALAQPALTATIQKLEGELGVKLFNRSARHVELTEAGRDLLPIAERLLQDLDHTVSDMRGFARGSRGHVSVVAAPSALEAILAPAIEAFTQKHPEVRITIRDAAADEVRKRVQSRSADFGLTSRTVDDASLVFETLAHDHLGLVCSPHHPLAQLGDQLSWDQLKGHELVGHTLDTSTRQQLQTAPDLGLILAEPKYQVSSVTSLHWMIRGGLRVAIVPALVAALPMLRDLSFRALTAPLIRRDVGLLFRRDMELSPVAERLAQECRKVSGELASRST